MPLTVKSQAIIGRLSLSIRTLLQAGQRQTWHLNSKVFSIGHTSTTLANYHSFQNNNILEFKTTIIEPRQFRLILKHLD